MALVYLDHIVIDAITFDEHQLQLRLVLHSLSIAGLQLKAKRCLLGFAQVSFLGHSITSEGTLLYPEKVRAIAEYEPPTTIKEIRSLIGFASYFRRFVIDFERRTQPLTYLLLKETICSWEKTQI